MDPEKIIADFLRLEATSEIASRHGLHPEDVRLLLRNAFPRHEYLRIAHAVGAKKVAIKLEDPLFRESYARKMKKSVRTSLRNKMRDPGFRAKWLRKAKEASVKGNKKIKTLLGDAGFYSNWSKKCSSGAQKLKRSRKGIFDPSLGTMRRIWSLRGLQKTGRKCFGPNNEKMYNYLEVQTARALKSKGLTYHYERRVPADNLNRLFSIDFIVNELPILLEVTYWDKAQQKCRKLERKFSHFRTLFPGYVFIVVTKPRMRDFYKRLLPDYINVLTVSQLESLIAGFHFSK